jgi:hypothetical protein
MPHLLHLDSSARSTSSASRQLTALFAKHWRGDPRTLSRPYGRDARQTGRRSRRPNCHLNDPVIVFLDSHDPNNYLVDC